MLFAIYILLIGLYIPSAFGGSLLVIDNEGDCLIWSNDNYGCTGYSAPFSLLHGNDCSALSEVKNGTRQDSSTVNVDICGKQDDKPIAQIQINKNGLVRFFNRNGNKTECRLNDGFKVGSWCSAVNFETPLHSAQLASSLTPSFPSFPTYTPTTNQTLSSSVAKMYLRWLLSLNTTSAPLE